MIATPVAILIKCLVVTNEWTCEVLPIDVQRGIRASRVIDIPSGLVRRHGAPRYWSDHGPRQPCRPEAASLEAALIDPAP